MLCKKRSRHYEQTAHLNEEKPPQEETAHAAMKTQHSQKQRNRIYLKAPQKTDSHYYI